MKAHIFFLSILLTLFLLSACESESDPLSSNEPGPISGSTVMVDALEPNAWLSDPYIVEDAAIIGDELRVTVGYGGGCRDHEFQLVAARSFVEPTPVEAIYVLTHESNNDPCEAWITDDRVFDLNPLKEVYRSTYQTQSGTIVFIIQGRDGRVINLHYTF